MLRTILFVFCWTLLLFRASNCEDVADFYSLAAVDINGQQVKWLDWIGFLDILPDRWSFRDMKGKHCWWLMLQVNVASQMDTIEL